MLITVTPCSLLTRDRPSRGWTVIGQDPASSPAARNVHGQSGSRHTNGRGIVGLAARGRASRPAGGAPLGPSRTLPTLKRVALSPTSGPRSGILDKRFGQKADMTPPNLLFLAGPSAVSLELLKSCQVPIPSPQNESHIAHRQASHRLLVVPGSRTDATCWAKDEPRTQLPGHGREAC